LRTLFLLLMPTEVVKVGEYINEEHFMDAVMDGYFYECVYDSERLDVSFELYIIDSDVPLFKRPLDNHWWQTGFKWGRVLKC
jgi:hypothetical protein